MPSKRSLDNEEFVFTISDTEDLSDIANSEHETSQNVSPKKRKRASNTGSHSSKKQRLSDPQDVKASVPNSEEEEASDGAMDSDFEFDMGAVNTSDYLEDFDVWGTKETTSDLLQQSNEPRKAVDVDEIIARRLKRNEKSSTTEGRSRNKDSNSSEQESSDDGGVSEKETGGEIFFDDENLAEDTFGATADSDDEDEHNDIATDRTELMGAAQDHDSASDSDSIASPVAHPDDQSSGPTSDDESQTSQSDEEEAQKRKAFFADEPHDDHRPTSKENSFQQFSLSRPILRALATLNFTSPTPIQVRTIPVALQGLDVVGSAQTGSGKTAAFLLPILERLLYRPRKIPTTRVAILMPTRELAVQCYNVAIALARFTDITFAQVVGGFSLREQEAVLKKRPDVVIATPGRFIDHMRNSASFAVENLEILVLDEADRMLEQGFSDELDEILKTIPRSRQTMLFSATMTSSVDNLVRVGMNKPVRLSVDSTLSTVAGLIQEFLRLRPGRDSTELRLATLCTLVTTISDYQQRTIIFFKQKKEAHRVRVLFGLLGLKAGELHGSMTQDQRIAAVNNFRDGKTTHLLATDVASRGLDIKNVHSVVNYEAPQTHEIYLHRVGRTARAGKSGRSCTLASEPDRKVVKAAVKSARTHGGKVASRVLDQSMINDMRQRLQSLADEVEAILKEEKQEKQLSQMQSEVQRGENLVKHQDEIMSRPRRTWFESEKEKQANKDRAKAEMNGVVFKGDKKRLSNKDKKKLDLTRARKQERSWKKGKNDMLEKGSKHSTHKSGVKFKGAKAKK